jgi:hypothetical protein
VRKAYWSVTLSLSVVFTASINGVGVRDHLLCPTLSRAFGFSSVLSCYFRSARPARVWFILSLLHAHELPSFHLGLHQWLRKMSIGSPQLNSRKHLFLMSRLLSQRRFLLSKVLGLMERIHQTAPVIVKIPPTMADA